MAENYDISYSFQTGVPTPAPKPPADSTLYAFVDCERVDMQNGAMMLIHKASDRQMIVAPEVSVALQSCRTFRTLDQHVQQLTSTIPQLAGQQADVAKVLEMVRDAGLLVSAETESKRLFDPASGGESNQAPTRVFINTCDRPAAVQRLLQSMLHAGNLSRHEHLFLVDDSRDPANAELNREVVEQFNLSSPRNMQYLGARQQGTLMDALIAEQPEHEAGIRFLLDRQRWSGERSYGLSRTLCLLLSVGRRAIVMDDDVICAAVESPHHKEGVTFGNMPQEVEFYASQQDILSRTSRLDFDPLSGHASCLGMSISQAIDKLGFGGFQPELLKGANAAYLDQWQPDSPVLMTLTGSMGDPGSVDTNWIFSLDAESSRRLLASAGGLEGGLSNRHYWMGQARPTFSKLAVISQMTGLDNSHLLPPYFPVFRGEDYLFGAMLEYLHPNAAILDYDWCVPHFPLDSRQGSLEAELITGKGGFLLPKYITDRTDYEPGLTQETRLKRLVLMLRELAESSDEGLLTCYRTGVAESQGRLVKELNLRLRDGVPRPQRWQDYLQQSITATTQAMHEVARLADIPSIPEDYDEQRILAEFRQYAGEFAVSLEAWPTLRQSARSITEGMLERGELSPLA